MDEIYDVAIVGYGPTGMAAAGFLGKAGHRVVVIERWPSLYGLPRLTHIDGETARILQEICDIDRALADSSPTVYEWVNGDGRTLLSIPTDMSDQGYPLHNSIYQPDIEDALDARLRTLPNVDIRQGWAVTGLEQNEATVQITVAPFVDRKPDLTRSQTVVARYAIGADGNRSAVRAAIEVPMTEYDFRETWATFDAEWLRPMPKEFSITKQYCDPARGHMFMGIGRTRQRFEFAILPGEDPDDFADISTAWAWLETTHGLTPDDLKPLRYLRYTFTGRVSDEWRVGRVFIAGDAAHTMPPYLGQGACSGIRDSANLAWKLDLVLRGESGEQLLDTYQEERRPHADFIVRSAIELGHVANTIDPEVAAARDAAFFEGTAGGPAPFPRLVSEALHDDEAAGTVAPQGRVALEGRTGRGDDVVGSGFTVIGEATALVRLSEADRSLLTELRANILDLDATEDIDGAYHDLLRRTGASIAVTRPDHIVFGAADDARAAELVGSLRGALRLQGAVVA